MIERLSEKVYYFNLIYTPLLILLGTIGNLLSIFIFRTGKLGAKSTSVYLKSLAISDTLFLLQLLPPWLDAQAISSIFYINGFCQLTMYLSYVTCFASTWIVVAFTFERYVAVLYPLRRGQVCTVKRARYVVIGVAIVALVIYLPVLIFTSPTDFECTVNNNYVDLAARFNMVDAAIAFTVPLAIIVVLNFRIMYEVCKLDHARRQLVSEGQTTGAQTRLVAPPLRPQHRITRMLLLISTVYVAFNLPAYTMRIVAYTHDVKDKTEMATSGLWLFCQQTALIFFNTNFGINFLLYCVSGQNFRRALRQALPMTCCTRRRNNRRPGPPGGCDICDVPQASSLTISNASAVTIGESSIEMPPSRLRRQGAVRRPRSMPCINRNRNGILGRFFQGGTSAECIFWHDNRVRPAPDTSASTRRQRTFPYPLFPLRRIRENQNRRTNDIEMADFT